MKCDTGASLSDLFRLMDQTEQNWEVRLDEMPTWQLPRQRSFRVTRMASQHDGNQPCLIIDFSYAEAKHKMIV